MSCCMCGDTACPSCGSAQGTTSSGFGSEAHFDKIYYELSKFLDEPCELAVPRANNDPVVPVGARFELRLTIESFARFVEKVFDNGEETGLSRLATWIQDRETQAYNDGRNDESRDRAASFAEANYWSLSEGCDDPVVRVEPADEPFIDDDSEP